MKHFVLSALPQASRAWLGRLLRSQAFSKLITEESDIHALRDQSIRDGMKPLRIAGADKVREGVTTIEEVLKVTSALF